MITHSSGNHAQAVARAAREAGVAATIVMPRQTPAIKREATVRAGRRGRARRHLRAGRRRSSGSGPRPARSSCRRSTTPRIIAGQGTVGLEIVEDLPDVATVFVPVSGGGLISGIAAAVKARCPQARVVGVEPELAGDLAEGFARGERVDWDAARTGRTIADGLRVTGRRGAELAAHPALVDDVVTVTEDADQRRRTPDRPRVASSSPSRAAPSQPRATWPIPRCAARTGRRGRLRWQRRAATLLARLHG